METTTDYGALFGVEDIEAGENAQELAEPANADGAGENERESAAPVESGDEPEADGGDGGEQSPGERAKYAAARRKAEAERDAAIERARAEAKAEAERTVKDALKVLGAVNPYTKKPIETKSEFDEYKSYLDDEKKKSFMRRSGMDDAEFNDFVENLPAVREARAAKEEAERASIAAQEGMARARIDSEIAEIHRMNPEISSLADLKNMPDYDRFYSLVKMGNTLTDAYKLANYDALVSGAANVARQSAMNKSSSKNHLTSTQTRGAGAIPPPSDVKAEYRMLNPDASDAEIAAHWARYNKT